MKYLILLIITNGFSYVASILLSHLYSAEQFGIIIGYITIANLISLLASLGIHEYSLRELSQNETPLGLLISCAKPKSKIAVTKRRSTL